MKRTAIAAALGVVMLADERERLARHHDILDEALRDLRDARAVGVRVPGEETDGIGLMSEAVAQVPVRADLEPVHLVPAAEVHLPDLARAVAVAREVLRPGEVLGEEDPVIAPGAAVMDVLAGHGAHARRRADGRRADRRVELDGPPGQGVQVLRPDVRVPGEAGQVRRVLVGHDQQDVHPLALPISLFICVEHRTSI